MHPPPPHHRGNALHVMRASLVGALTACLCNASHRLVYKKRGSRCLNSDSLLGGGYLLSHFRSTIGVVRLNFSVRNGKRWDPHAITTLLPSSPYGASCMCRGCVIKKRNHRGNAARENHSRDLNCYSSYFHRARPFCLYLSRPPHRSPRGPARGSRQESFRVISTARLRTLPPVHLPPINVVVFNDPKGDLILRLASCLDAFSTYPYPTRLPGRAPGGTTGWPEVGPTRSSRTSVRSPQISNAHNR